MTRPTTPVRTALCLCGGGISGGMYAIGALTALDDFFRPPNTPEISDDRQPFRLNDFDLYVGTSAGAFLATVLASGFAIEELYNGILRDDRSILPLRTDIYRFDREQGFGIARDMLGIILSATARKVRGQGFSLFEILADLRDVLPAGIFSLHHYEEFLDRFLRQQKLATTFQEIKKELYITANDLDSGHRAIFGQGELTDVPLAKAICASSAIPLFFEPVRHNGRDYIDGAVGKVEHADIAFARGAELVVIINPLVPFRNDPSREGVPSPLFGARHIRDKGLLAVYNQAARMSTRTKLHQGIRRFQASHPHTTILLIEPREEHGDMFMHNLMNFTSRQRMVQFGYESTARLLLEERQRYETAFARNRVAVYPEHLYAARLQLAR